MKKTYILIAGLILAGALIFGVSQFLTLQKVHSTFENYYAFRGCTGLISKGDDFGVCKTSSGDTIKIVKFQNKWYLDHDLPTCILNICL